MNSREIAGDQATDSIWALLRRQWMLTAMVAMAVVGIGIAAYLTTIHYTGTPPVCSNTGIVDCSNVLKSPYSVIPGTTVPITIPGALWFVVSGGLALAGLISIRREGRESSLLALYQVIWSAGGLAFVLYLIYDEVRLTHLCEWCTGVHILTFLTFCLAWYRFTSSNRVEQARAQEYRESTRQGRQRRTGNVHGYALPRSARSKVTARRSSANARSRHH